MFGICAMELNYILATRLFVSFKAIYIIGFSVMFDALARTSGNSDPIRCPVFFRCLLARKKSATDKQVFMEIDKGELHPHSETVLNTQPTKRTVLFLGFDVCVTVPH